MNAEKRWGIGLMAVGVIGVLVALSVELPASDGQIGPRFLAGLALNMAQSPMVWVGAIGVFLWFSGSKKERHGSGRQGSPDRSAESDPPATSTVIESENADRPLPAYPIPSPVPATTSGDPKPRAGAGGYSARVIIGAIALIALVGAVVYGVSRAPTNADRTASTNAEGNERTATTSADQPGAMTTIPPTNSSPAASTSSITSASEVDMAAVSDVQISDFLTEVVEFENRERPNPDQSFQYSTDYWLLHRAWDENYKSVARETDKRFAQQVSEALIRRSDEFLLWSKWFGESGTMESDDPYYEPALAARAEADQLFEEIRSGIPTAWKVPSVGADGTAGYEAVLLPGLRPDAVHPQDLIVGDCYEQPAGDSAVSLNLGACSEGSFEVYWVEDPSEFETAYPGDEAMRQIADDVCNERLGARFPWIALSPYRLQGWTPDAEMYALGDTYIICGLER